jgi:hypothetical protein
VSGINQSLNTCEIRIKEEKMIEICWVVGIWQEVKSYQFLVTDLYVNYDAISSGRRWRNKK